MIFRKLPDNLTARPGSHNGAKDWNRPPKNMNPLQHLGNYGIIGSFRFWDPLRGLGSSGSHNGDPLGILLPQLDNRLSCCPAACRECKESGH